MVKTLKGSKTLVFNNNLPVIKYNAHIMNN